MTKKLSKEEEAQIRKEAIEGFGRVIAAARKIAADLTNKDNAPCDATIFGVFDRIVRDEDGDFQPARKHLLAARDLAARLGPAIPEHVFAVYDRLYDEDGREIEGAVENLTTCCEMARQMFGLAFGQTDEEAPALDIFDRLFGVEEE